MPGKQSGYRQFHGTETAVTKVYNDLLLTTDHGDVNLTAAFDTVDHDLLMLRLERQFSLRGVVLQWFRSYPTGRTFQVVRDDHLLLWFAKNRDKTLQILQAFNSCHLNYRNSRLYKVSNCTSRAVCRHQTLLRSSIQYGETTSLQCCASCTDHQSIIEASTRLPVLLITHSRDKRWQHQILFPAWK